MKSNYKKEVGMPLNHDDMNVLVNLWFHHIKKISSLNLDALNQFFFIIKKLL